MAVNLSPYGGVGAQFLDNSGNVLTGGKIETYAAGTTTNQVTYTTSAGNVPHSNPIILDASGRVPSGGEIWLTDGFAYKFILRDSNDVLIATYDNVTGINSNFIAFTNQQEIQTATAGQTVFNLTTITYQPATNSLTVFVDGVNQYGPGAQYAYLETDGDTVTFVNGLHVGAEVKFTTSQLNSSGLQANAFQVSYTPPFTNSVGTNVGDKLAQTVSVQDFGATGDGTTDDTTAIQAAITYAQSLSYGTVYFPQGQYKTTASLTVTRPINFLGDGSTVSKIIPTVAVITPCLNWGVIGNTPRPQQAVVIEKLGFDGAATTNANSHGIYMWCSHTEIKDCVIQNFSGHGIYGTDAFSNIVRHNWIASNSLDGIHLENACNIFVISDNYILASGNNGIQVNGGNKVIIDNNDIESNQLNGIYVYNATGAVPIRSCQISNNYFEANNLAGSNTHININRNGNEISNINVTYNYFENDGATFCVFVNGCNSGTVINNQTTNGYLYYPAVEGENVYSFNNNPATAQFLSNLVYSPNVYENTAEGYVINGRVSRLAVNSQETFTSQTLWSVQGRYAASPFPTFTIGTTTQVYGSAPPVSGANVVGNIVWNTVPAASGNIGWVCTTAGTPGTWKTFGAIAA